MSGLLPRGYISVREAAAAVEKAMTFGIPYNPMVTKLRMQGLDVGDLDSRNAAFVKLWAGVNERKLPLYGIHPQARQVLRIPADIVEKIPALNGTRIASLHFLRHSNHLHNWLAIRFNVTPSAIELAVRTTEIQTFVKLIVRSRHRSKAAKTGAKSPGRPKKRADIANVIKQAVEQRRWSSPQGIKALTQIVNRSKPNLIVSDDTVSRALDDIFANTKDRRFERMKRGTPLA